MNPLPSTPDIGNLEVVEVYEYFDGPVLFTARNERDQAFLVTLAEDQNDRRRWLLVPMSKRRYEHVRSGGVDLYDAFAAAEGGYVYSLSELADGNRVGEWKVVGDLLQAELPLVGEALDLDTVTLAERVGVDVAEVAGQARREVVTFRLAFRGRRRSEAPAGRLGQILDGVQNLLYAIGQGVVTEPTRRGVIPANVVQEMEMDVASVFAGSFGVELRARETSDLFGDSYVGDAIEWLVKLLEVTEEDNDNLAVILTQLKGRSTAKYRELLLCLECAVDELNVAWGSPKAGRGREVKVTNDRIAQAISIIGEMEPEEPVDFTITGRLIGLNVRTKTYELWDMNENRKLVGRVVDEAMPTAEHATISNIYVAEIREETETTVGGDVETRYRLLSLTPARHESDDDGGGTAPP